MIKPRLNRLLLILALIGIALYLSIAALYGMNEDEPGDAELATLSKQQASDAALTFIQAKYELKQPQTYVVFQSEPQLSGYLQKEKLERSFEQAYRTTFSLDYFQVEVWDPDKPARYVVQVHIHNGTIRGWDQVTQAASSKQDLMHAQRLAEQEMTRQGYAAEDFTLQRQSMEGTHLTYQQKTNTTGKLRLKLDIHVEQNVIVGFAPKFSVPDDYLAWLEQQDNSASLMTWISMGFTLTMTIVAIGYAIRLRVEIDFRRGVVLTLIVVVLYFINNINQYPAYRALGGFPSSSLETWINIIFYTIITTLLCLSLYVSLVSGNRMWERSGKQLWPSWKDSRFGSEVFYGMGRGYLLCFLILGIQQTLFYIAQTRFDMWSVNDPTDSPFNLLMPGLYPTLAWVAAITEEAAFRLFGIILFKKLFRSDFIAILLPSIIWAASHTQYPIYPVYTRLVEVTLIGIVFGYAFLKYGFITALLAHACLDSLLMGLSLFYMDDTKLALLGIGYILLPAVIGYFLAWLHGKRRKPPTLGGPPPRLEAL